ncbi:MAG: hypothetical protein ACFE0Q_00100 [Anaerolineae bacterium]
MRRIIVLMLVIACAVWMPLQAQELTETYRWDEEGARINYPSDWEQYIDEAGIVHLASADTDIFFYFEPYDADDDLAEYVEDAFLLYRFNTSATFDADEVLTSKLTSFEDSASYAYIDMLDGESFEREIFAVPLAETWVAMAIAVPVVDDVLSESETVLEILSSLALSDADSVGTDVMLDNGYTMTLGADWQAVGEGFSNGEITVTLAYFPIENPRTDTRASRLRAMYNAVRAGDAPFDEDLILFIDLNNDENAVAYVYQETAYSILIAFSPDDDIVIVAQSIANDGGDSDTVLDFSEDFYVLIESIR